MSREIGSRRLDLPVVIERAFFGQIQKSAGLIVVTYTNFPSCALLIIIALTALPPGLIVILPVTLSKSLVAASALGIFSGSVESARVIASKMMKQVSAAIAIGRIHLFGFRVCQPQFYRASQQFGYHFLGYCDSDPGQLSVRGHIAGHGEISSYGDWLRGVQRHRN